MSTWHIITGEYPPQNGGVSDYTRMVACELAEAGDDVHVWMPACPEPTPLDTKVKVHRLPDHFGLRSMAMMNSAMSSCSRPRRLLVQYVPHAFGWNALNIPFCLWLLSRRKDSVWVIFHEVAFPLGRKQPLSHNVLGVGTRLMALLVARAAERIFVSIPAWEDLLKQFAPATHAITWLPVPSNIPVVDDPSGVAATRSRYASGGRSLVGHFGTYGQHIKEMLMGVLPTLLHDSQDVSVLLLGRKSENFCDDLTRRYSSLIGRVHAVGALSPTDLSRHLSACDVLIQPYPDGVSSRRSSVMAGLSHGLPIVTTVGPLTESLWMKSEAVTLAAVDDSASVIKTTQRLLADAGERSRMSIAARALYQTRFDIRHTIAALRGERLNEEAIR